MPTFKQSKGERALFSNESLNLALKDVLEINISVRKAAKEHNINRITLGRYCKKSREEGRTYFSKLSMVTKQVGCIK